MGQRQTTARQLKPMFTIRNGSMEWVGRTKKEAEAKRDEQLNRLFGTAGSDTPTYIRGDARWSGMVYQDHSGFWMYQTFENREPERTDQSRIRAGAKHGLFETQRESEYKCRRHLAQLIFQMAADSAIPLCTGMALIHASDAEGRKEHRSWFIFQVSYRVLQLAHAFMAPEVLHAEIGPAGSLRDEFEEARRGVEQRYPIE